MIDKADSPPTRDEVLKRMLKMKPKPHKPDKTARQKPAQPKRKARAKE